MPQISLKQSTVQPNEGSVSRTNIKALTSGSPEDVPGELPSARFRFLQGGTRVTRWPLGSGPELHGTVL